MNQSWREVALEEVVDEITVGFVGPMADQYIDDGIPFLRSLNVEPYRVNAKDLKSISTTFHHRLKKSALKPGDIVIVRTGKPGSCAVIPDWLPDANCSDLVIVRPSKDVRPAFLSYVINSATDHVSAHTVGAVQQHFNVGSARQLRFHLPSLAEQDEILEVLGTLDRKISVNSEINVTCEAIARGLFTDWFIDFGPTRAKMAGREPYLSPELWSLFPELLNEEGVPKGWGQKTLHEVLDITSGGTPKTSVPGYWNGGIPLRRQGRVIHLYS
jgi:type I restriction enzyme S subunit